MRLSLGRTAVLSGVIGPAVRAVLAQGCGGDVRSAAGDDASVPVDGSTDDAPVRCSREAGIVETTILADLTDAGRGVLWLTTYSVDPACCGPQLQGVIAYSADAGIGQGCVDLVELPCGLGDVDAATGCPG